MMQLSNPPHGNTPSLTHMGVAEFSEIADYAKKTFGLHLPPAKREMVFARLIKRLRRNNIADFSTYLSFVKSESNAAERNEFLSALTTNVTQFFREPHHFQTLRTKILPNLISKAQKGQRVRLWSAGCSAGQEAYTLAMVILDMFPDAPKLDVKILASDIDPKIISVAKAGLYPESEMVAIPEDLQTKFVVPAGGDQFSFCAAARELISFAELNLIEDWPMRGTFDVIFCRNVAIYFDGETQETLWKRFSNQLVAGGYLFIGHSERLTGTTANTFANVGITTYCKTLPNQDCK